MKAIAAAIIIGLVGLLLVGIQQYRVVAISGAMQLETKSKNDAIAANKESEATITTLRAEAQRNAAYQKDLTQRIKVSEDKAKRRGKTLKSSRPIASLFVTGLLSLCLTACAGSPQPVLVKTTAVRLEPLS